MYFSSTSIVSSCVSLFIVKLHLDNTEYILYNVNDCYHSLCSYERHCMLVHVWLYVLVDFG